LSKECRGNIIWWMNAEGLPRWWMNAGALDNLYVSIDYPNGYLYANNTGVNSFPGRHRGMSFRLARTQQTIENTMVTEWNS